jgi:hypothetical protein
MGGAPCRLVERDLASDNHAIPAHPAQRDDLRVRNVLRPYSKLQPTALKAINLTLISYNRTPLAHSLRSNHATASFESSSSRARADD